MKKEVDIFIPCSVDLFSENIATDLINVVESLGFKARYRENQTCCGELLYTNGNFDEAKRVMEKFIDDFKGENPVISCSTKCVSYIKTECANLFHNTSNHNSYKNLAKRVMDITEFIHHVRPDCNLNAEFPFKVFFQSNCHSINRYDVKQESLLLLKNIKGLTLVNEDEDNICCGAGGLLELYNKYVSDELAKRKVERAISLGADYITSTDNACLMRLQSYINKHNINLKTIHIVSLLRYSSKQQND